MLGDFNIHIDRTSDCYTKQFQHCLESFGLVQHVTSPTHSGGHILDLIITKQEEKHVKIIDPMSDYFISDHCFVTCNIEQYCPPLSRKLIKSRSWKSVSKDILHAEFEELNNTVGKFSNVDELVSGFTRTTSDIVNKHAPLKERTILCRPTVP